MVIQLNQTEGLNSQENEGPKKIQVNVISYHRKQTGHGKKQEQIKIFLISI